MQNNGKEMYKNSVLYVQVALLLIRPIDCFGCFLLPSPRSVTRFYILFELTIDINESFAFSPG